MKKALYIAVLTEPLAKGKLPFVSISVFEFEGFDETTQKARGLCSQLCVVQLFSESMNNVFHPAKAVGFQSVGGRK